MGAGSRFTPARGTRAAYYPLALTFHHGVFQSLSITQRGLHGPKEFTVPSRPGLHSRTPFVSSLPAISYSIFVTPLVLQHSMRGPPRSSGCAPTAPSRSPAYWRGTRWLRSSRLETSTASHSSGTPAAHAHCATHGRSDGAGRLNSSEATGRHYGRGRPIQGRARVADLCAQPSTGQSRGVDGGGELA